MKKTQKDKDIEACVKLYGNMRNIKQSMLEDIYLSAILLSRENKQVVGKKMDFYITLEQLEILLKNFQE